MSAKLFKFMAINLGVDEEALLAAFKPEQPQSVRINHYPPCSQANKVLGLSPHTDGVGMTLLLQVNDVQGLQIRKDGRWFAVKNLPGALVVNVGDVLEVNAPSLAMLFMTAKSCVVLSCIMPLLIGRKEQLTEILEKIS